MAIRAVLPPPKHKSADPGLPALAPFHDMPFLNQSIRLVMVELPAGITGLDPIQCWGSTAIFDNGNAPYHPLINRTGPAADRAGA
jgi:hypothetical protein